MAESLAQQGIAALSMAADYDRDWHFASLRRKEAHVERVYRAVADAMDSFQPQLVVSSVGGETTRVVTDAIAHDRGVPTAYFNALPIPGRFVMLASLDAPFVPYDDEPNFLPSSQEPPAAPTSVARPTGQSARASDVFPRLWSQAVKRERTYPPSWIARKVSLILRDTALRAIPPHSDPFNPEHDVAVLYPLHDERDFQVAVRERHAVPQAALLTYLSSVLPPGTHLYVKPHPEHAASHHPALWKSVAARPNIHFLPASMSAKEAINQADVVLTLASSLGFEALTAGKPVVCYGSPFYSRRGLTTDVSDPRDLASAISAAVGTAPDQARLTALGDTMRAVSWPGQFTPLSLEHANLSRLAQAVRAVAGQT